MMEYMGGETGPIRIAAGPREAEREVVAWVKAHRAKDATELWPPLRIVVPSRSLRRHLLAVLTRELGALAGVIVQTHRSLAREVLERAGEAPPPGGSAVQEVLVRKLASEQEALSSALGGLEDGYAPVAAAVRDLVDAGLDPVSLEAVAEAVSESARGGQRERCLAVVRVAGAWLKISGTHGLPSRSGLLVRATELLQSGNGDVLPSRGVLVHGFAEATGLVTGVLEALVRRHGAHAILDLPPDPARPSGRDAGWTFTERLADRLEGPGWLGGVPWQPPGEDTPDLEAFKAPGPDAELREVASRIRRLLDDDTDPETIGVVARSIDTATAAAVRRHFGRLGIPFSGEGVTLPAGEATRRLEAVLELLSSGGRAGLAAWLTAVESIDGVTDLRLLELALRSAGMARLDGIGHMDLERLCPKGSLRLPVVERIEEGAEGGRRIHRTFPRAELEAARRSASALLERLGRRPGKAPAGELLAWVRTILDQLGLAGDPAISGSLDSLATELPESLHVAWRDLEPVLSRTLRDPAVEELGGAGGGVQVLTVMEARSRTFEHLFLVGLNRGLFPRKVREDAVLPEPVRRAIAVVLPEMPWTERARVEERYLFAQLMAASPRITLSWQTVDADGRARNTSAFVERLQLEKRLPEDITTTRDVFGERPPDDLRPTLEHATVYGLAGQREGLVAAALALDDGRSAHLKPLLDELDPPRPRDDPGPFLGLTGTGPPEELWATRLEAYSNCPWKQFLERELGLAPPPEALLAGTSLKGLLVGSVVHQVLEAIAQRGGAPSGRKVCLEDLEGRDPVPVSWPDDGTLQQMILEASRGMASAEGAPALAPALARTAEPYLEQARMLDWSTGYRDVLGAEISGACPLELHEGGEVTVHFRADRVDRKDGALILTDYKSGTSGTGVKTLLKRGERLQAAIYAWGGGEGAVGRYLYLSPESPKPEETLDRESAAELARVVEVLVTAWRTGITIPRWETSKSDTGPACRHCELKEACFKGDSTFRARLERVIEAARIDARDPLVRLWDLPTPPKSKGGCS